MRSRSGDPSEAAIEPAVSRAPVVVALVAAAVSLMVMGRAAVIRRGSPPIARAGPVAGGEGVLPAESRDGPPASVRERMEFVELATNHSGPLLAVDIEIISGLYDAGPVEAQRWILSTLGERAATPTLIQPDAADALVLFFARALGSPDPRSRASAADAVGRGDLLREPALRSLVELMVCDDVPRVRTVARRALLWSERRRALREIQ